MNMMGALVFGMIFAAVVGGYLASTSATKANTNCDTQCDAQVSLGETLFLLIGSIGVGVVGGLVPPPTQWFKNS